MDDKDPFWQRLEGSNQYPESPGAQKLVEEYIAKIDELAQRFMHLVAECLSSPEDTFDVFQGKMSRFKALARIKIPGLFTFLSQDNTVEGNLVIKIQQGFEAITGGVCAATTHRVTAPTSQTRYSNPFFLDVRLDLTLDELKQSASHIVRRIPASDDRKKRAVDVPSEFLSRLYSCFGEAHLRNRILCHPDVGKQWYPELYSRYSQQPRQ
ncbi:Oxoglutarate/iron-dependent dioxygenase [Penicillium macrosclerotiorum]|uniref:Oxoglutarate/iron-dependent dioxygenase n=1 Tax=Penicillium macrosclerotiorum TaxID=303699 RepID=UPI0025477535|nr:Oxoglutarate/iron-dependent dioxygenase [Penicillium macrosclerotiorum]KAJ5688527.1 Oxoglutarate/iron-dependent dioxygenase [Penicillium macrosclerotiorum]